MKASASDKMSGKTKKWLAKLKNQSATFMRSLSPRRNQEKRRGKHSFSQEESSWEDAFQEEEGDEDPNQNRKQRNENSHLDDDEQDEDEDKDEVAAVPNLPVLTSRTAKILLRLIEYVHENALMEEGLYRREGSFMERNELFDQLRGGKAMPDLRMYDPHAITALIKWVRKKKGEKQKQKAKKTKTKTLLTT
jgi:hypothetical protein